MTTADTSSTGLGTAITRRPSTTPSTKWFSYLVVLVLVSVLASASYNSMLSSFRQVATMATITNNRHQKSNEHMDDASSNMSTVPFHGYDESNSRIQEIIRKLILKHPSCQGKEPFLKIVLQASSDDSSDQTTTNGKILCDILPTKDQVVAQYGPGPIVYGLETCKAYRSLLSAKANKGKKIEPMPRVAGLYHTGTNALARTFQTNLKSIDPFPRSKASPYNVPWGKHLPPQVHKWTNVYPPEDNYKADKSRVLPVVIVRDPLYWMQSLCKKPYDASWEELADNRCPNLVQTAHNNMTTYRVTVRTHQTGFKKEDYYNSLADMWSNWTRQYLIADYPRLMIRFEDLLYWPQEVVQRIRDCIGMPSNKPFVYEISAAKRHGDPADYVSSLARYVGNDGRYRGLNAADRAYAQASLDPEIMRTFGYKQVSLDDPVEDIQGPFPKRAKTSYQEKKRKRSQTESRGQIVKRGTKPA